MEGSSGVVRALGATPRYGYGLEEDTVEPEGEYDGQEEGDMEEMVEMVEPQSSRITDRNKSKTHNTVHDELEWMRNNLSHLGTRIDRLTAAVNVNTVSKTSAPLANDGGGVSTWTEQLFDMVLYLVTGVFVIVILDMLYRAGQRAAM